MEGRESERQRRRERSETPTRQGGYNWKLEKFPCLNFFERGMLRRLILKNGGSNYLRYVLLLALPKTTTPIVVDLISYIY
jgi:hypothetical protein